MRWLCLFLALVICAGCVQTPQNSITREPQAAVEQGLITKTSPATAISATPAAPREAAPALTTPARPTPTRPPRPTPTYDPDAWKDAPVIPTLSPHALAVLERGLESGLNPRAFSKIGDCESQTTWFLGNFDLGPEHYALGPYEADLAPVVEHYNGSFNRLSLAAKQGFTAASLLSPIWSDRALCKKNESPLACEFRVHRPLVALILVGTNDATNPKTFEGHMRKVITYSLSQNILPILGTKADNIEGNHQINATIARLAYEYDVPLWNYWGAVQGLPGHGLQEDGAHLTYAAPHFDDPKTLRRGWPVRNLNALQVLRIVMDATQ